MTEDNKKGYVELEAMGGTKSPNPYGSLRPSASKKSRMFASPAVGIATFLYAAAQNELELVQGLLDEESVKVNDCDYDKRTALHVAACEGHTEVVRILIAEGADVNFADRYNATPLDDAIHHGHQEVAKMLVERGAKNGASSNFGLDLVYAAGQGDLRTVQRLIDNGIPIQSTDFDLRTPLHVAIAGRHIEVVQFLLEHGAELTTEDRFGGTPLEEAHRAGVRLGEDPILNLVMHHAGKEIERKSWRTSFRNPFFFTFFAIEIIIGILFAIFSKYGLGATAGEPLEQGVGSMQAHPFYMDVHVMIFIGFGFLMTFLRKYGYTAVGLTFILGSLSIQVYQLSTTFWENVLDGGEDHWKEVEITVYTLIKGDFAAGAVLISFGALLGKVTFTQMLLLSVFEVFFYSLNEAISIKMQVADIGGSMVIHMFGAFFGLAASFVLTPKSARGNRDNSAVYHSDIFSMIGTVFLWIYWPSFNGALSQGNAQHRAVINTVLSLTASCVFAFMFSQFWRREKVFNMVDIQNATLAGGVAMGSAADMALHPAIALLVGAVAGTLSVFGFAILQGIVENTFRVHDTCGVLNLHGMPGLLGGFVAVIVTAAFGSGNDYSITQQQFIYPGRVAPHNRSASSQAKVQLAFIFITLAISIGTALFSSFILSKLPYPKKFFLDSTSFETPGREVPYFFDKRGEARHSSDKASEMPSNRPVHALVQPDAGAPSIDPKQLADLQNKIASLENALRSQRRILREQAKAFEDVTGVRVAGVLQESVSSMSIPKFTPNMPGPSLIRSQTDAGLGATSRPNADTTQGGTTQGGITQGNLAAILESLSRQVGMLVESQKQQQQQTKKE